MSRCDDCQYYKVINEDESMCQQYMTENFQTDGGCYKYEESDDWYYEEDYQWN